MPKRSFLVTVDTVESFALRINNPLRDAKGNAGLSIHFDAAQPNYLGVVGPLRVEEVSPTERDMQEALTALRMIREAVETLGPIGAMPAEEHLDGPTLLHEAEAIVAGITKMKEPKPVLLDPEYDHLEFVVAIDPTKVRGVSFYGHDGRYVTASLGLNDKFEHHDDEFVSVRRKLVR